MDILPGKCVIFVAYMQIACAGIFLEGAFSLYSDCVKLDTLLVIDGMMWSNALLVCIRTCRNTFQAEFSFYLFIYYRESNPTQLNKPECWLRFLLMSIF